MNASRIFSNGEMVCSLLEDELKRCQRYQNFTSILLLEAHSNGAKKDDSRADHSAKMATLVRRSVRETDLVGTVDGDIVIVVLLYSDKTIALKVGDRLNAWISNYIRTNGKSSQVLSVGGACFPSHATDSMSLYQKAIQMLESARAQGGNCVQILD